MTISKAAAATVAILAFGATTAWASPAVTVTAANDVNNPVRYSAGPYFVRSAEVGCDFDGGPAPCDQTQLTVSVPAEMAATHRIVVWIDWGEPIQADYDLYVLQGGSSIAMAASTTDPEIARFPAISGQYTINVESFQPYGQTVNTKIFHEPIPSSTPALPATAARFHTLPPVGINVSGGEPSIGVNWKTGTAVVGNSTQAAFVTFNDGSSPATSTWVNRPPRTNLISFDPILFTDRVSGHTVVSQLVSDVVTFSNGCSLSSVTSDDGLTWIPAEGCGPPSGADHQAIGGGPHHAPMVDIPGPLYGGAVYYCAQSFGLVVGDAFCSRSDDGGLTYGPGMLVYTSECGGLHGHPRVAPDGTVYIPNKNCAGPTGLAQGVVVSEDNGLTWTIHTIPGTTSGASDPSVATGLTTTGLANGQASNTVYFGMCDGDGRAKVAVSRDLGATWGTVFDVGAAAGIKNCVFPEMIAGDDDRASMFFLGTTTAGSFQAATFTGEWHAYVATTYDGGATWGLYDATPNDPVQMGCIWMQGGSNACRNLLDFNDITIDKEGRPLFVFADGCTPPGCISGSAPGTSRKAINTIGRQSGGRTLFAAYDSTIGARIVPGAPRLSTISGDSSGVTLKWAVPDNGGSDLTGYRIHRSTAAGQELPLVTIAANKPEFVDRTAYAGSTYFYQVSAINANGEGGKYGELSIAGQVPPNAAPVAALSASPVSGTAALEVTFSVGASDPDAGDVVSYDLDFGDGSEHATGNAAFSGTIHHTYTTARATPYAATLTVGDSHGLSTTAGPVAITVSPAQVDDTTPEAFTFVTRTNVATSVYITSETRTITGINVPVQVTVANGQYRINGGAWTSAQGMAVNGDSIALRHISAAGPGGTTTTTVSVGTHTTTFTTVTSNDDRTPDAFNFTTQTGVELSSEVLSNIVTPTGFNTAITVVPGTGSWASINGGPWTNASTTMSPGQSIQTRHVSSSSNLSYTKTSVKLGTITAYFTTRTK